MLNYKQPKYADEPRASCFELSIFNNDLRKIRMCLDEIPSVVKRIDNLKLYLLCTDNTDRVVEPGAAKQRLIFGFLAVSHLKGLNAST